MHPRRHPALVVFASSLVSLLPACLALSPPRAADPAVLVGPADCRPGDACEFDFGVLVKDQSVFGFDVVNFNGDAAASLAAATITGAEDTFAVDDVPPTVLPSARSSFSVVVSPRSAQVANAVLELAWSIPDAVTRVSFTAAGRPGVELDVPCGFGDVPVGTASAPCVVRIVNHDPIDVEIDELFISSDVFVSTRAVALPMAVPPGGELRLDFVATPPSAGLHGATFSVRVKDAATIVSSFDVNGV